VSPDQFLAFARVLPEPLCLISGEGEILAYNPPTATLLRLSDESLRAHTLFEFTTEPAEVVKRYLRSCSSSREMIIGSLTLRTGPEKFIKYRCEGAVLQPRSGDTPSRILLRFQLQESATRKFHLLNEKIAALAQEIQVRRQAQEEAQAQRERLRITLISIGDAVIATDEQGHVTFMNPVAEGLTGWAENEATGKALQEIFHIVNEYTRQEVEDPVTKVLREEKVIGLANHTILIAKDGAECPIDDSGAPIRNEQGDIIGVILVFRDVSERKLAEQERDELLLRERSARAKAELAEQRASFLARIGEILASTLDFETRLKVVAQLVVPEFADWCAIDMPGPEGSIQRITTVHQNPAKIKFAEEVGRRYPPDPTAPKGVPNVLRTGQAELYPEITDEILAQGARDQTHLEMLRSTDIKSVMIVPLVARERTLAALTFVTGAERCCYTEDDLNFAQELARRAALAVDNARLYQKAEAALGELEIALEKHKSVDRRLSALIEASNTLLGSMQLEEVQQAILDLSKRLIASDAYAVWRKETGAETWRVAAAIGLSEEFQKAAINPQNFNVPPLEGPLVIESVKDVTWLKHRQEAYQTEGIESFLAIPLTLHGEFVGTITFYYRTFHQFTEIEIRVATALANLAAAAIRTTELYQEQSRLRGKAEEASRLKDEFLATVSHELRTPLNAILGWTRLLRGGHLDAETRIRALETIEHNARSQNALIEDILDVSRIITGRLRLEFQTIELLPILEAALASALPTAEAKGVRLITHFTAEVGAISGDAQRIQQIIWNLLANAIKFTPKGGRVEVHLAGNNSQVEIIVSDTGVGIQPDFLPFVFDRFRQEDSSSTRLHGGLGLGLAIVRHLVELHGGKVSAESRGEGKGATFKVIFPVTDYQQESSPLPIISRPAETGELFGHSFNLNGLRILIVDDDEVSRELLTTALFQSGAVTQAAASTAEALTILDDWQPDLLVSDIGMPVEDGYSLLRQVRERQPDRGGQIPAVALTAYAKSEDRLRALAAGFQMHIAKPIDPIEFLAVIASLTGRLGKETD
jgi:PAS domain S-box-containing protein